MKPRLFLFFALFFLPASLFAGELHDAVEHSDLKKVRVLLQHPDKIDINKLNEKKLSPLHLACIGYGQNPAKLEMAKLLLKSGADLNLRGKDEQTPLHLAAKYYIQDHQDDGALVRFLVKAGADANLTTKAGQSTLFFACALGNVDIARLVIKSGADVNVQDNTGRTLLMFLVDVRPRFYSYSGLMKLLLESGARINDQDEDGKTALIYAAAKGNISSSRFLLQAGANPQIIDEAGKTALDYALENKYYSIIYYLQQSFQFTEKQNTP